MLIRVLRKFVRLIWRVIGGLKLPPEQEGSEREKYYHMELQYPSYPRVSVARRETFVVSPHEQCSKRLPVYRRQLTMKRNGIQATFEAKPVAWGTERLLCIGCGCLSLKVCNLRNPWDSLSDQGSEPLPMEEHPSMK
jgi:hypothetical protein